MLFVAGIVLLALGLLCGALLLLIPLGVVEGNAGLVLWILFPVFAIGGYLMAAASARGAAIPMLGKASGAFMMALALAAAVVLVLQAAAILQPTGSTLSLWYVLGLGIVLGATGLASHARERRAP